MVERYDVHDVIDRLRREHRVRLEVERQLAGGEVGAWLVAVDGRRSVLTWAPGPRAEIDDAPPLGATLQLVEIARAAGIPAPAINGVYDLEGGDVVVLQEHVDAVVPRQPTPTLVAQLLALTERRVGLLVDHPLAQRSRSLHLLEDGPGYCVHASLRGHEDAEVRELVEWIEQVGAAQGDALVGTDLVHYDHHLLNVLVDESTPDDVAALIDWNGARGGSIALDLIVLVLDLERRFDPVLATPALDRVRELGHTVPLEPLWAHALLRSVDWSIRHHPDQLDAWLRLSRVHRAGLD